MATKSKRKKTITRPRGGASHPCPVCSAASRVRDTRRAGEGVERQRVCVKGHEFTTREEQAA